MYALVCLVVEVRPKQADFLRETSPEIKPGTIRQGQYPAEQCLGHLKRTGCKSQRELDLGVECDFQLLRSSI